MPQKKNTIQDRKIKFALVGCGRVAKSHVESLKEFSSEADLVSLCDSEKDALKKAEEAWKAPGFPSLTDLLKTSKPDVVILSSPSGLHPAQTKEAAAAGCHVITEKPMATRWEEGIEMIRACDEARVHLFVVMQNRKNDTLQLLKKAVLEGRFGKIYFSTINVFWTRPQSYYDEAPWRGTPEMDGGMFMNQATHYIDLLTWLLGPIDQLQAFTSTLARKIKTEDTGVVSVKWRSGALGSVNATMLTYPKNLEGSITILGERGSVRVGGVSANDIQLWNFEEKKPEDDQIQQATKDTTSRVGKGHSPYYQNVIKSLRGTEEPHVNGIEGLKSLQTLIAIQRSSQSGKSIQLPLEHPSFLKGHL